MRYHQFVHIHRNFNYTKTTLLIISFFIFKNFIVKLCCQSSSKTNFILFYCRKKSLSQNHLYSCSVRKWKRSVLFLSQVFFVQQKMRF